MYRYEVTESIKNDVHAKIGKPYFYLDNEKWYVDQANTEKSIRYFDSVNDVFVTETIDEIFIDLYGSDLESNSTKTNYSDIEIDVDGRQIVRTATTKKGWHYQAHSVQFEVNKLGSIYNKDIDGNDLGFATLKVYDDQGNECTTQGSADTNGVQTIVKWEPDFDFEIISGQIRQLEKETVDSYVHVRAMVATGLPSPNNWLPVYFTHGGINLNYIGADEVLKTDGRSSKFFPAGSNGDHFEIVVNYEADLLTNTNRHKMSVIFEIYKDPTT